MSKAVVTGAAGRIGGSVASTLRRLGHRVVGVDLRPPPEDSAACDVFVECDLAAAADTSTSSHGALVDACAGATVVVHCAAWPGPSAHPPPAVDASGAAADPGIGLEPCSPAILLRDNVGATSAVCDAAIRGGASRVVFSSSAFALGFSHAAAGPQAYAPKCARGHATPSAPPPALLIASARDFAGTCPSTRRTARCHTRPTASRSSRGRRCAAARHLQARRPERPRAT